jgi:hypothetical protein
MATKKKAAVLTGNRQAAYSARNRAALIKHAQEVLAEVGPSATIEQLSAHAQVSPTTIYKYFFYSVTKQRVCAFQIISYLFKISTKWTLG